jgi:predicted transcriptional regulator
MKDELSRSDKAYITSFYDSMTQKAMAEQLEVTPRMVRNFIDFKRQKVIRQHQKDKLRIGGVARPLREERIIYDARQKDKLRIGSVARPSKEERIIYDPFDANYDYHTLSESEKDIYNKLSKINDNSLVGTE